MEVFGNTDKNLSHLRSVPVMTMPMGEVFGNTDKNLSCLRLVPVVTMPMGVVSLLGGVAEVCWHFTFSHFGLVISPGKILGPKFGSARWRHPQCRPSVGSFVFGDTDFFCSPPVLAAVQG
jgi:hypothetical protein